MSSATVVKCLNELFALFGLSSYVHTDKGTSFMSAEVQKYLNERGVATSRSTARGNGQIEKQNSSLWKAITLALHSQDFSRAYVSMGTSITTPVVLNSVTFVHRDEQVHTRDSLDTIAEVLLEHPYQRG
uniref:Integrase catalytic domain-containing protein n=1 Tax=Biomphalaria glabrata TaxID=6526 RepID=A0A2C9LUB8_BIOGL